jgi:transcription termination factor Rho
MSVLDRATLEASPLADLHALASELGMDGFRRLRKAELIDALLAHQGGAGDEDASSPADDGGLASSEDSEQTLDDEEPEVALSADAATTGAPAQADEEDEEQEEDEEAPRRGRRRARGRRRGEPASRTGDRRPARAEGEAEERIAEGAVELLGNGSAFLRVNPPEISDDDVYISAAQVRRCELVSGDRITGPARAPRRSERYPSLVRIDTINGAPADAVAEGTHYEDLPAAFPVQRFSLGSEDPTLKAIEWLTPLGRGSRAVIVGAPRSGKTEALRRLTAALAEQEALHPMLLLIGARPEEVSEWKEGPVAPLNALSLAASAEAQGQALERAVETARRIAARGEDAVLLVDTLDGVHPPVARKALAAARNIVDGGSLTVIGTANRPFGGETTVIAFDVALTSTGRLPALDLVASGTLRPELLVGTAGALAIAQARAEALD